MFKSKSTFTVPPHTGHVFYNKVLDFAEKEGLKLYNCWQGSKKKKKEGATTKTPGGIVRGET